MRLFCLIACCLIVQTTWSQSEEKRVLLLMGSRFEIHLIAPSQAIANDAIDEAIDEIKRIESVISSWDKNSESSKINAQAGIEAVKVSQELIGLIERAIKISELSHGAFDITAVVMNELWKFDGSMQSLPPEADITALQANINYKNIIIDKKESTVFLKKKGMKIGFGSIGKGYAAYKSSELLKQKGIKHGLINAGGDLYAWGNQINGLPWKIGIVDPKDKTKTYSWLDIKDMAVVTSGDYEKRVTINGNDYSHIIDPRTAYPVNNGLRSVTIIAPNPEFADALATGIFVLGPKTGLYILNQLQGCEGIFVNNKGEITSTEGVSLKPIEK